MKRKHIVIICMAAAVLCVRVAVARTVVVDASDRQPLVGASVFDKSGTLVAITDADGAFGTVDLPATVRCLGYEAAVTGLPAPDTLSLHTASYELGEMTLNLAERDVLRLICYVRSYVGSTTSVDTTAAFNEFMVDYMIPVRKLKKYKGRKAPRMLACRGVSRYSAGDGRDSISTSIGEEDKVWLPLAHLRSPKEGLLPDSLRGTTTVQTVPGKYGPIMERRVTPTSVNVSIDALADKKDHRFSPWFFKLFGLTMDLTELRQSMAYSLDDAGNVRTEFLQMSTTSISAVGRGKLIRKAFDSKTPVDIHMYFEVYPVDREFLTVNEAKEADKSEAPEMEIVVPASAAPLDAATKRLLERAEKETPRE